MSSPEAAVEPTVTPSRLARTMRWVVVVLGIIVFLYPMFDGRGFVLSLGANTLINATLGLSLILAYGMGGMISLAQVGFGALAAYIVVIGQQNGYNFIVLMLVAIAACILVATLLGWPVVRLGGVYFLTATFAFTELLRLISLNWTSVTGGSVGPVIEFDGLTRLPGAGWLGGFMKPEAGDYVVSCVLFGAGALAVWLYGRSRSGRNLMSLRDNERIATAMGMNAVKERVIAFALSAAIAAVAGVYLAYYNGIIDPMSMNLLHSIDVLIIVIVGGLYSIKGALVGAIVVTVVPEILQISLEYRPILFGLLLIVFAVKLRLGIVGELRRLRRRLESRGSRRRDSSAPDEDRSTADQSETGT